MHQESDPLAERDQDRQLDALLRAEARALETRVTPDLRASVLAALPSRPAPIPRPAHEALPPTTLPARLAALATAAAVLLGVFFALRGEELVPQTGVAQLEAPVSGSTAGPTNVARGVGRLRALMPETDELLSENLLLAEARLLMDDGARVAEALVQRLPAASLRERFARRLTDEPRVERR